MIIRENIIEINSADREFMLKTDDINREPEELIFFDLEHYVYKKPKCIGVFGACIFEDNKLFVTQYMIENKYESIQILELAKKYFLKMKNKGKKAIVTFSGNNDYTVINYLFKKYGIEFNFSKEFEDIDIQREYEKAMNHSIGLKNLEKDFDIHREGEVISGSNLAKTFNKVLKDKDYILRMPKEKIETILLYNEQDVTNLYNIYMLWNAYVKKEDEKQIIDDKYSVQDKSNEEFLDAETGEIIELNKKEILSNQENAIGE
ncbi:ribonuclease H-like domain-containing protein [Clostridium sp. AL.422]|uniref:ribonuclease H-like domain-containing protein n=1 Tax=Clostridium TaxID=1485 RepID=UPI00293DCEF2|nr:MULTISPECIES: ribonuclease H-like domain-containing protein [unclassified Clostridium]MDV4150483.1 ribonuclease H-like domain-containing protein [Clostridium sp. AL.422]